MHAAERGGTARTRREGAKSERDRIASPFARDVRRGVRAELGFVLAVSLAALAALLFVRWRSGSPLGDLTRDPAVTTGAPFYIGFLSNAGIFLWAAAAAICLFSARLLARDAGGAAAGRRFLLSSGAFTLLLGFDDVYMLHEHVLPRHVGIPEPAIIIGYIVLAAAYLAAFRAVILKTEIRLLGLALFLFALSVGIDLLQPGLLGSGLDPIEDGAKFAGIAAWLAYLARASEDLLARAGSESRLARGGSERILPRDGSGKLRDRYGGRAASY